MSNSIFPSARMALLLLDVINLFDFPGGEAFARLCAPAAKKILKLREAAHRSGVPVVYVNDNFRRWRSDFKTVVAMCSENGRPGSAIARMLEPTPRDYFVLKPMLSGFHETPLQMLLQTGGVNSLVLTGFAADNCVLFTAADAHMRHYRIRVPADCVASEQESERRHVLAKMKKLFNADTKASVHLRLRR